MEVPEFKDFAKEMVDYIGNYLGKGHLFKFQ